MEGGGGGSSKPPEPPLATVPKMSGVCGTGYPLKLYFQIPCVFPVRPQIFPVPIYIICEYNIHRNDLVDLSSFWK